MSKGNHRTKVKNPYENMAAKFDGIEATAFKNDAGNSSILLLLSIHNNEHCTGPYLEQTVKHAVNQHKQTFCLIADEINWHNRRGQELDNEIIQQLKHEAFENGSKFIKDNLPFILKGLATKIPSLRSNDFIDVVLKTNDPIQYINQLAEEYNVPFKLMRWSDWLTTEYRERKLAIEEVFKRDSEIQEKIQDTAKEFVNKQLIRPIPLNDIALQQCPEEEREQLLLKRSIGYLTEESIALYFIIAERGINFIAYPGKIRAAFVIAREFLITRLGDLNAHELSYPVENPDNVANWLHIAFKRIASHAEVEIEKKSNKSNPSDGFSTPDKPVRGFKQIKINRHTMFAPKLMRSQSCPPFSDDDIIIPDKKREIDKEPNISKRNKSEQEQREFLMNMLQNNNLPLDKILQEFSIICQDDFSIDNSAMLIDTGPEKAYTNNCS